MRHFYTVQKDGQLFTQRQFESLEEANVYITEMAHSLFPVAGLIAVEGQEEECNWEDYMPANVSIYFINYDDDLEGHPDILQQCIAKNEYYPITEKLDDWWDFPERYYMDEICKSMCNDGMEEEYDKHYDEIRDWLWEHDDSDPVKDLLSNTRMVCYYDLGYEADGWHEAFLCNPWRNTTEAQEVANIRRRLGIKKGTPDDKILQEIIAEASYGGNLRIYFEANWDELINCKTKEDDYKSIRFNGMFYLGVVNTQNGSGWVEKVNLDCTFPFVRENLILSEMDHYCWEEIAGMCSDWCRNTETPAFSYEKPKTKRQLSISKQVEEINRQSEYDRVFKAGGCTYGDMDMHRHRDVYYKNEIPCGSHCPHCGTFWID